MYCICIIVYVKFLPIYWSIFEKENIYLSADSNQERFSKFLRYLLTFKIIVDKIFSKKNYLQN